MSKDQFLRQLEKKMHLKQAKSHVDVPAEKTLEQLETELKRAELEKTKAETHFWEEKRQGNIADGGDEPVFGLASNQRRKRFSLPKRSRPGWK